MEKKQRVIVGVNEYVEPDEKLEIPILYIGEEAEEEQKRSIAEVKPHARRQGHQRRPQGAHRRGGQRARREERGGAHPGRCPDLRDRRARSATPCREVYGDYSEGTEI